MPRGHPTGRLSPHMLLSRGFVETTQQACLTPHAQVTSPRNTHRWEHLKSSGAGQQRQPKGSAGVWQGATAGVGGLTVGETQGPPLEFAGESSPTSRCLAGQQVTKEQKIYPLRRHRGPQRPTCGASCPFG